MVFYTWMIQITVGNIFYYLPAQRGGYKATIHKRLARAAVFATRTQAWSPEYVAFFYVLCQFIVISGAGVNLLEILQILLQNWECSNKSSFSCSARFVRATEHGGKFTKRESLRATKFWLVPSLVDRQICENCQIPFIDGVAYLNMSCCEIFIARQKDGSSNWLVNVCNRNSLNDLWQPINSISSHKSQPSTHRVSCEWSELSIYDWKHSQYASFL